MTNKFQNKYRIESARMKNYDYWQNGAYFITIVTKNRDCFFGEIVKGKMILNEIGKIVWDEWFASEKLRENIKLDEFVIMPNHVHGIVLIDNMLDVVDVAFVETLRRNVSTNANVSQNAITTVKTNLCPIFRQKNHRYRI